MPIILAFWEAEAGLELFEFEVILVYKESPPKNPVLKTNQKTKK